MKTKNVWYCNHCGAKHMKWQGQCLTCKEWNCLSEEVELSKPKSRFSVDSPKTLPKKLSEIALEKVPRINTHIKEFDRLIGGGIVQGGFTLIGGDPGIGKSTLMLQLCNSLAKQGLLVLYISGEESLEQTAMRAKRLQIETDNLLILSETEWSHIHAQVKKIQPDVLIVDSIQIVYKSELPSAPGSVSQMRECACEFMQLAKGYNICTFLIGHVTKMGEIAGPKMLEHLVDTVLYLEGDKQLSCRLMRVIKNRFGPTDEVALFEMCVTGLREVENPSKRFLDERNCELSGSIIIPAMEGSRAMLVETQALVTPTHFPTPSRRSTGLDQNRLALLLAVLEKRLGFKIFKHDVFVAIAGGLKIKEPGIDLGVLLAVATSMQGSIIPADTCVIGEVGLGGEVRSPGRIETRLKEACNLGFKRCILPAKCSKSISSHLKKNLELCEVKVVENVLNFMKSLSKNSS